MQLNGQLMAFNPSPVVALHRAVAVAEVEGPAAALSIVDALELETHQPFHVIRGDLLRRLGRVSEARQAYEKAIAGAAGPAERGFLQRRLSELPR